MSWFQKSKPTGDDVGVLIDNAKVFARTFAHDYVGVEHLFLALQKLPSEHVVWTVLRELQIDLDAFFKELEMEARVVLNREPFFGLPYTPRSQVVLKLAEKLARKEQAPQVSALHLFASVLVEGESLPARVLANFYERVHRKTLLDWIKANARLSRLFSE